MLLGEKIKPNNLFRVILIISICALGRYSIGNSVEFVTIDQYIIPTLGFSLLMVVLGEIARQIFRKIIPYNDKHRGMKYVTDAEGLSHKKHVSETKL